MLTRRQFLGHTAKSSCIVALGAAVLAADDAANKVAGSHRLLILDNGRKRRPESDHQLLLVDVESGKVVARQEIGSNTSLAVSPKGDVVAAV